MTEPKTVTVNCKVCGKPVVLQCADGVDEQIIGWMMGVAKGHIHTECMKQKECEVQAVIATQRKAAWSDICPPWYHKFLIERLPDPAAYQQVMEWKLEEGKGLVCFGPSRSGKTWSCWQLLKRQHDKKCWIIAMTHLQFAQQVMKMYRETSQTHSASKWMNALRQCDLLFIDDLGKSRFTNDRGDSRAAEEAIFDILDYRTIHLRPVIFTTQYDDDKLLQRMSESTGVAFVARLTEFCTPIEFKKRI